MTWKAHADYVCKKVTSRVSILSRVRSFVTKEAATLAHNALIFPLFDYCDIAWSEPSTPRYRSTTAPTEDLHGLSHVSLAHLKQ